MTFPALAIFLCSSTKKLRTAWYLETIKKEIEERDYQDTHREISPLKKAEDAIELDTSSLTLEEVVEQVLTLIQKAKEE